MHDKNQNGLGQEADPQFFGTGQYFSFLHGRLLNHDPLSQQSASNSEQHPAIKCVSCAPSGDFLYRDAPNLSVLCACKSELGVHKCNFLYAQGV